MILSDKTITTLCKNRRLVSNIQYRNSIQPASCDITLGDSFSYIVTDHILHLDEEVEYETVITNDFLLMPKQFVLATTKEYIRLPNNITAFVEGRSSIGRLGLFIQNAGWVDPGFEGQITLEIFNASNYTICLKAGVRVGQLVFAKMDHPTENPYRGKYQGQVGATGSMLWKDFESEENPDVTSSTTL